MTDVRELLEHAASDGERAEPAALYERARGDAKRIRVNRRRSNISIGVSAVALLVVGALAIGRVGDHKNAVRVETPPSTAIVAAPAVRYEASGTVLQDASHRPELCLGAIEDSLPPQCGGTPITNWNWAKAPGAQTAGKATWGEYRVVGTYDGTTFTVTEAPAKFQPDGGAGVAKLPDVSTPCSTPPGGWKITDPTRVALADFLHFQSVLAGPADYSGSWEDRSTAPGPVDDIPHDVYNVQYTTNLDQHRAELAKIWGGPICVSQGKMTQHDLRAIVDEVQGAAGKSLGLQVLDAIPDDRAATITAKVLIANADLQRAVDARFGAGRVKLVGALKPVP